MPVVFEEMAGSPAEEFGEQGFNATRILRCDWSDRLALAIELRGGIIGGVYVPPAQYPHFTVARCQSIGIVGHDDDRPMPLLGDTSKASYSKAILTCQYGVPTTGGTGTGDGDTGIVFEEDLEPNAEFLTADPSGLAWGVSGDFLKPEEAPGILFRSLTWVYTRHFLTSVPSAILTLPGHVNAETLSSPSLGLTFDPETLLFNGPRLSRQVTSDGTATVSLTYKLAYREQTFNKFFRAATGSWEQIYEVDTGNVFKPYPPASFIPIITG